MQITEVKVFPVTEEKLKAFVSIVVDDCFMINDIKVIRGKDGLFVSMPSRKKKNGDFKDVAHPLNNETRQMIEERVLGEYERVLVERGETPEVGWRRLNVDEGETQDGPRPVSPAPVDTTTPVPARPRSEATEPIAAAGADGRPAESPAGGAAKEAEDEEPPDGKSLEEIQEMHLRDSFWSVS